MCKGKFNKGNLIEGTKTLINGVTYEGVFNRDGNILEGTKILADGTKYDSTWQNIDFIKGKKN